MFGLLPVVIEVYSATKTWWMESVYRMTSSFVSDSRDQRSSLQLIDCAARPLPFTTRGASGEIRNN